jgi:NAD(P)-dependent dehydrogenase (short-subunit alcohol dehydrogenase family)
MSPINRRQLIMGGVAAAAAPALAGCGGPSGGAPSPPFPGAKAPPRGPFGKSSTAEEVTAGVDLAGKTALVTGATSGIGLETMRVLALRGAHVLGTGRTLEKARAACAGIAGRTTPLALELEDWDSIVACASEVRALDTPIDMLICNAGVMAIAHREQVRGIEKQFAVNHLGHFIFANRLLDAVKAAPAGRIVVLGSGAYKSAPPGGIEFDNFAGDRDYDPQRAYGQSKLANHLFVRELARRLQGSAATANTVHPGVILTNLGRHLPEWQLVAARLIGWIFMKTIEQGAATSCYVATSAALTGVSGYFFQDCNPLKPEGPYMEDDALAGRLWQTSEELTRGYFA